MTRFTFLIVILFSCAGFAAAQNCPPPFPAAKFHVEDQPDSPLLIRDLTAELVQNKNDAMHYGTIRVTFYFDNRSLKKIKHLIWDSMPDEDEDPGGGISSRGLLPGESERHVGTYHTQQGPTVVFRVTEIAFTDGTGWKARRYDRRKALRTTPVCVVPEKDPSNRLNRSLTAEGWSEPIFSDRIRKTIDAGLEVIDGVTVQSKHHEIRRERLDKIARCPPDEILKRIVGHEREYDFDVEKYSSYEVRGRTFGYLITYDYVDEARQFEIGVGSGSFFVDRDGGGKFTLLCEENETMRLPAWVKELASRK